MEYNSFAVRIVDKPNFEHYIYIAGPFEVSSPVNPSVSRFEIRFKQFTNNLHKQTFIGLSNNN